MSDELPLLPSLANLHMRHFGVTDAIAKNYAEGAAVCMQRHHVSPKTISIVTEAEVTRDYIAVWEAPTERQHAAW